ncbi:MAG: hypothetical protein EP343_12230 [Deltaproteobacteria bacterium]|nr:MAG: hypothetical protein EP343_12230 [Deltaproteobacteria bacterium]
MMLHVPMPWDHEPIAALLSVLALLLLPGALLLTWLAPSVKQAQHVWNSPGYIRWSRARWVITPLALAGTTWSLWHHHAGWLSMSLLVLSFSWWFTALQERIIITNTAAWRLGFPIQATRQIPSQQESNEPEPKSSESEQDATAEATEEAIDWDWNLGERAPTARYRHLLFAVFGLSWSAAVVVANQGNSARLPGLLTFTTATLWLLGLVIAYLVSRFALPWRMPSSSREVWREAGVVQRLYLGLTLPLTLLVVGWTLYHAGVQLWVVSPLDFSMRTVFLDLLLASAGLWLLADPSGINAWVAEHSKDANVLWVRRFGWVEQYPQEGSESKSVPAS